MKKLLLLILSIIYITTSSGIIFNIHYCKGKISSVQVDFTVKDLCKCGSGKEAKGCCKTEQKLIKITDTYKASFDNVYIKAPVTEYFQKYILYNYCYKSQQACNNYYKAHAPPYSLKGTDTHLYCCVFRI